jgi:L-histidine Nalpha-methyltransferase
MSPGAQQTIERQDASSVEFAAAVTEGLRRSPKRLPPRYFYDDLGSALFEAICRLPWYPVTRAEKRLISRHAGTVVSRSPEPLTILELGCGTGEKLEMLVAAFVERRRRDLRIGLIDVSAAAIKRSVESLSGYSGLEVRGYQASYEAGLESADAEWQGRGARLILLLGSNIGNFDPPEAAAFLRRIRAAMSPGDMLLLGADLVKPEAALQLAYDDPLGLTAAFNLNMLLRINRELAGDFDLAAFIHRARWEPQHSRVEMHLVSACDQLVRIKGAGIDVRFGAGETIWTESSYKFDDVRLDALTHEAGFTTTERWTDEQARFRLLLLSAG